MQKNIAIAVVFLGMLYAGSVVFAQENISSTTASGEATITFPIPVLGNCTSKDACKVYCSDQAHIEACISFGESHGLMNSDEAQRARTASTINGPGGCLGQACQAYCDNPDHVDECLVFAQAHGLVNAGDVKILKAIRESGGPGGCRSETECRTYCSESAHGSACQQFAQDNGFRGSQEATGVLEQGAQTQPGPHDGPISGNPKVQKILATSAGPGGCKTEDVCRTYCSLQAHMSECLQFGKDKGLISQEEYDRAEKLVNQPGPGGCTGEACKAYCEDSSHSNECFKFAEEKGFITKEEADKARTFIDKPGPGGCHGSQCQTYCDEQSHHDECTSFAVQNGFMTQAQADQMQNLQKVVGPGGCTGEACRRYCEDSAHRDECVSFAKEHGMTDPQGSGQRNFNENTTAGDVNQPQQADSKDHPPFPPQGLGNPPTNMTPEQQKQYDSYMQNHPGQQPDLPATRQDQYQRGLDMQTQEQYTQEYHGQPESNQPPQNMTPEQQRMYQQYQQAGTSSASQPYLPSGAPVTNLPQGTSSPGSIPPSASSSPPTSSIVPLNLVAAVFSIFSHLFKF